MPTVQCLPGSWHKAVTWHIDFWRTANRDPPVCTQDCGLNGRGAHLTDPRLIASLKTRCSPQAETEGSKAQRAPLRVHFHGTPRQWQDRRRPWIVQEKERSVTLLREAGVPVTERLYFAGRPPSLRQHFEVIPAMQLPLAL